MSDKVKNEVTQEFVLKYAPMINYAVSKVWARQEFRSLFRRKVGDRGDAISIATLTFYRCAERFQEGRSKFTTYAIRAIHYELWKSVRTEGVIKIPGYTDNQKVTKETRDLMSSCKADSITDEQVLTGRAIALHKMEEEKQKKEDLLEALHKAFKRLTPLEERIIRDRYGMNKEEKQQQVKELAATIGKSKASVLQTVYPSLGKMRRAMVHDKQVYSKDVG